MRIENALAVNCRMFIVKPSAKMMGGSRKNVKNCVSNLRSSGEVLPPESAMAPSIAPTTT